MFSDAGPDIPLEQPAHVMCTSAWPYVETTRGRSNLGHVGSVCYWLALASCYLCSVSNSVSWCIWLHFLSNLANTGSCLVALITPTPLFVFSSLISSPPPNAAGGPAIGPRNASRRQPPRRLQAQIGEKKGGSGALR